MKQISLIVIAMASALFVHAQSAVGLKGGLNLSSTTNQDMKLGYHVGILAHLHMGPKWALQPEVVYSNQGADYGEINGRDYKVNLNYINVPFLFQYMAGNGLRLQTGPQVGFLTSVSDKLEGNALNAVDKNDFKETDFSWSFGVSYLGRSNVGIDARYNLGLTDINVTGPAKIKNNVGQIGVFMLLR